MREARLTFGERFLCPFLRPFFLSDADEHRVRARRGSDGRDRREGRAGGAREAGAAARSRLTPEEERLARIAPGYETASTASRLDAFLLPGSLKFAEYNAESPAGLGYSETMAEIFDALEIMARFRETWNARYFRLADAMLDALLASYREWGGRADPPTDPDHRLARRADLERVRDAARSLRQRGVTVIVADPRDLTFEGGKLIAEGQAIDLVYRRVLIADIIAREAECGTLVDAYEQRAVCMANTLRCKIPHKKAFFAVLTDERTPRLFSARSGRSSARTSRGRACSKTSGRTCGGEQIDLLPYVRACARIW